MIRRILLVAAAFVLLSASPAHAQYFQVTMTIDSAIVPGQTVTVTVTSFAPGTTVNVQILPGEVNIGVTNPGSGSGATTTTAGPATTTTMAPSTTSTMAPSTTTTMAPMTTTTMASTTTTEATTTTSEATTTTTEPSTTTTSWSPGSGRPPWAGGGGGWWSAGGWWPPSGDSGNLQGASWNNRSAPAAADESKARSLGAVTTDASGKATAKLLVPANMEKGKALVAAHGLVADGSEQVVKSETLVTDQASTGTGESASGAVSQGVTYVPAASQQPADRDLLANPLGVVGTVGVLVAGSLFLLSRRHRSAGSTTG